MTAKYDVIFDLKMFSGFGTYWFQWKLEFHININNVFYFTSIENSKKS